MVKTNLDADGRSKCAQHFIDHCFFEGHITEEELVEFAAAFVPPGFQARRPAEHEAINSFPEGELAFPISHFEVGLRLPLWQEIRQILKYYGAVPAQLNSNAIAMMMAFACFLRRERIEFNLAVFRKLFSYKATPDGVAYFGGSLIKVRELANKNHNWMTRLVFIKGELGNIPFRPLQKSEDIYRPPSLSGSDADLHKFFLHKDFEVAFLRRGLDSLQPVLPGEGERVLPEHPPFADSGIFSDPLELARAAAAAFREEQARGQLLGKKRLEPGGSSSRPDPSLPKKKKAKVVSRGRLHLPPSPTKFMSSPEALSDEPPLSPLKEASSPRKGKKKNGPSSDSTGEDTLREPGLPKDHPHFGKGCKSKDAAGEPILKWDEGAHRVSVSTRAPSWGARRPPTAHAFAFGFGLYSRDSAESYKKLTPSQLDHEGLQAHLRAFELHHMMVRRGFQLSNALLTAEQERDLAKESAADAERRFGLADALLAKSAGGLDAEAADALRGEVAKLQAQLAEREVQLAEQKMYSREQEAVAAQLGVEVEELKEKNKGLLGEVLCQADALLPPGASEPAFPYKRPRVFGESDVAERLRVNSIEAAECLLKAMRGTGILAEGCEEVTVRELLPTLFPPSPLSEKEDSFDSLFAGVGEKGARLGGEEDHLPRGSGEDTTVRP
ncbi:hypothetical protein KSP39_PZI003766 [Platanthera zijinensis]|uniref:Transposase (putative) gypsy type domain-containing protein n=1 Tax=Platanthera zijinensis TaxID=2320716 RepID=A0AAP0GDH6_9ASPA